MRYVLAVDQGTSSTRAIVFDQNGLQVGVSQLEHKQYYPQNGWVEHNPGEIWKNVKSVIKNAIELSKVDPSNISSIGITNQRETVVAWDKNTGNPVHNAIVWQCRRTASRIDELKQQGYADLFKQKTGLVLDAYFSGTKIEWLNSYLQKQTSENSEVIFGTIDSWIVYKMAGTHATDASNASRTLLFDITKNEWSSELAEILHVNIDQLPEVKPNHSAPFGYYSIDGVEIPITGILGDQQAALFGQTAFSPGMVKNTYGTGNFTLLNTGTEKVYSKSGLLTTIAWNLKGKTTYALEGSVFVTGAALRWLRDGLEIIKDYSSIDGMIKPLDDTAGLYFVPAFVGLGAPYWDSSARGTIIGITGGTKKEHLVRATIDSIAYQTQELVETMNIDSGIPIQSINVDGGITRSNYLLQRQADISQIDVVLPREIETTAFGAALVSGLGYIWDSLDDLNHLNAANRQFSPTITKEKANTELNSWKKAVQRSVNWINH